MKKILRWAVSAKILLAKTSILILININSIKTAKNIHRRKDSLSTTVVEKLR